VNRTNSIPGQDFLARPEPLYLGEKRDLFAWLHRPVQQKYENPVVICSPVGFEYIRAHRTIRRLAENLSAVGFIVLRFDYHGCGDSIGSDRDDDRVAMWLESIASVVQFARELSKCDAVNLIGLRMGATLAYKSAENCRVANLVLWNPCVSGATFVRDMQIVEHAGSGHGTQRRPPHIAVDAAGFVLTDDTVSSLSQLQMSEVRPAGSPAVFLVERDDLPASSRVLGWLTDRELADEEGTRPQGNDVATTARAGTRGGDRVDNELAGGPKRGDEFAAIRECRQCTYRAVRRSDTG